MRIAAFALASALGLAVPAVSALAAPAAPPALPQASNIIETAAGCGWAAHPNRWGRCVTNDHYYRPHAAWRGHRPYAYWHAYRPYAYWWPHWRGYYGGGYGPGWGSPTDRVANQLNWQELHRFGY